MQYYQYYAMFFAGMLAMGVIGGLVVLLILRPWVKPVKKVWRGSQDVMAEHLLVSVADAKKQAVVVRNQANQAAIEAEETRARLIEAQGENNKAKKNQHREALRQDDADEQIQEIEEAIKVEEARARLIRTRRENDQQTLPLPKPKNWFVRHRYLTVIMIAVLVLTVMILIRIVTK